jgi:hypothetical protein
MATFNVTIGAYTNLPPTRLGMNSKYTSHNGTIVFTVSDFTNTIPSYVDPEGDAPSLIKITTLPTVDLLLSGVPVTLNQEIDVADINSNLLTYIADAGTTTEYDDLFYFDIADTGSLTFPGLLGIMNIYVTAKENEPPSVVGDGSATIAYGETLIFTSAMFSTGTTPVYSDPEGDNPAQLKILTLPTLGIIYYNGTAVVTNQIIDFTDIDTGLLTYVPDNADVDGDIQGFTFAVSDDGSGEFTT